VPSEDDFFFLLLLLHTTSFNRLSISCCYEVKLDDVESDFILFGSTPPGDGGGAEIV
jgi:hypothetical protein